MRTTSPRRGRRVWLPAAAYVLSLVALVALLGRTPPQPSPAVPALAGAGRPRRAVGGGAAAAGSRLPPVLWRSVVRGALPQLAGRPAGGGGLQGLLRQAAGQAPYVLLRVALPGLETLPADPPAAFGGRRPAPPSARAAAAVPGPAAAAVPSLPAAAAVSPPAAAAAPRPAAASVSGRGRGGGIAPSVAARGSPSRRHATSGTSVCGDKPVVLVYQTHAEESFDPALGPHTPTGGAFSEEPSKSVVHVGDALTNALCASGIAVVHLRTRFDLEGRIGAYLRSLQAEKAAMKRWPSLRVLIDVHRDVAPRAATTAVIDGLATARVLTVVGTDATLPEPGWRRNAAWAVQVYRAMNAAYPGLARSSDGQPYFADGGRLNQQLTPAALLFEIGGEQNTMAEELRGAKLLGRTLAGLIQAGEYPR